MVDDDFDEVSYKDVSELKRELEEKKSMSAKDLHESVKKLSQKVEEMLQVFDAAAEQVKLEEKEYISDAKKHEAILSKLDKIAEQNKNIAESVVNAVEMLKERSADSTKEIGDILTKEKEPESFFKPVEQRPLFMPQQTEKWQPKPEIIMQRPQPEIMQPIGMPSIGPPPIRPLSVAQIEERMTYPGFESGMPPMQPEPPLDLSNLEFSEEPLTGQEPKKKSLFGMFKK